MNFLIDIDTYKVDAKSEDAELLADYILTNKLSEAVFLIADADDLSMEFTIPQMDKIFNTLTGTQAEFDSMGADDAVADALWESINEQVKDIPKFTKALGKRLMASANKKGSSSDTSDAATKPKAEKKPSTTPKATSTGTRLSAKALTDKMISVGMEAPVKKNHVELVRILEENLGEMSFADLLETAAFELDKSESLLKGYITDGIRKDYFTVEE